MRELKATKDIYAAKLGVRKIIIFNPRVALVTYDKVEKLKTLVIISETETMKEQRNQPPEIILHGNPVACSKEDVAYGVASDYGLRTDKVAAGMSDSPETEE